MRKSETDFRQPIHDYDWVITSDGDLCPAIVWEFSHGKSTAEFIVAACNSVRSLLDEVKGWREAAKLWSIERRRNTEVDAEMQAEIDQLRRERKDYETTVIGIADRTGSIAMKCVKAASEMQEKCAVACEAEAKRAKQSPIHERDSEFRELGYLVASNLAAAIRSLTLPEPAEGAT